MAVRSYSDKGMQLVVVETYGFKQFSKAMRTFDRETREDMMRGIKQAVDPIVQKAKSNAPKRSGRMAGTIKTKWNNMGVTVEAGGARAPYAPVIEFAHSKTGGGFAFLRKSTRGGVRGRVSGTTGGRDYSKMKGAPPRYLYKAVSETEAEVFRNIDRVMQRSMSEFWEQRWNQKD